MVSSTSGVADGGSTLVKAGATSAAVAGTGTSSGGGCGGGAASGRMATGKAGDTQVVPYETAIAMETATWARPRPMTMTTGPMTTGGSNLWMKPTPRHFTRPAAT